MADVVHTTNTTSHSANTGVSIGAEDLMSVRSRIAWGAIFAGAVLALAIYFLLTLLGGAIGLSISDKFEGKNIGQAAAVYAIAVTAVCLFAGGFVAAQLTAGENKREAGLYGLMVWATLFAMLLWLAASGVKAGFNTMVGLSTAGASAANAVGQNVSQADAEDLARKMGISQQQIDEAKAKVKNAPAEAGAAANDPATRAQAERKAEEVAQKTGEVATRVTWYTFLGTLISMLAAVFGGMAGAGPSFRLFAVPAARHTAGVTTTSTSVR